MNELRRSGRLASAYVAAALASACCAAAAGACGEDAVPVAPIADAASDTLDGGADGRPEAGGFEFDSAGFDAGNAFGCQGGCPAGQYCMGTIIYPSREPIGDAAAPPPSPLASADRFACRDAPDACASAVRCGCLIEAGVVPEACAGLSAHCVDSDAGGGSTVTCTGGGK